MLVFTLYWGVVYYINHLAKNQLYFMAGSCSFQSTMFTVLHLFNKTKVPKKKEGTNNLGMKTEDTMFLFYMRKLPKTAYQVYPQTKLCMCAHMNNARILCSSVGSP